MIDIMRNRPFQYSDYIMNICIRFNDAYTEKGSLWIDQPRSAVRCGAGACLADGTWVSDRDCIEWLTTTKQLAATLIYKAASFSFFFIF